MSSTSTLPQGEIIFIEVRPITRGLMPGEHFGKNILHICINYANECQKQQKTCVSVLVGHVK